jgi:hypothetical protein
LSRDGSDADLANWALSLRHAVIGIDNTPSFAATGSSAFDDGTSIVELSHVAASGLISLLRDHVPSVQQRVVTVMHQYRLEIALSPIDELWTSVMASHSDSVVHWVSSLPLLACTRLDENGCIVSSTSLLPSSFATTISTLVAKLPPPLSKLLADHLARGGIFIEKDLENVSRLALRLARNDLLFIAPPTDYMGPVILLTGTPKEPSQTHRRIIDSLTPFGRVSKFHALMARLLQRGSRKRSPTDPAHNINITPLASH